jgi:hypothetical protein
MIAAGGRGSALALQRDVQLSPDRNTAAIAVSI